MQMLWEAAGHTETRSLPSHQQPPRGGGRGREKARQRYGECGGTKTTRWRSITVVKPCCRLMCCDNGDKERLRKDPSEWAAEERELVL